MFQFFINRTKRQIRAFFVRAKKRGYFSNRNIVRGGAVFFILTFTVLASPAPSPARYPDNEETPSLAGKGGVEGKEKVNKANVRPSLPKQPDWPRLIEDAPNSPELSAAAVLVVDGKTRKTLLEKNSQLRLPPASLTKIMTALVALEKYPLDKEFIVSESCLLGLEGKAQMSLKAGERLTTETLLYGVLLNSASDAVCVLARDPESVYDDSRENENFFVARMNEKAQELGLQNTSFLNPIGTDAEGHYSTASDLLTLSRIAMQNPVFRKIVGNAELTPYAVEPEERLYMLFTTNELLKEMNGWTGIKTGTTGEAGECLAASWVWKGREIYSVILGSDEDARFKEMQRIREWVESSYQTKDDH